MPRPTADESQLRTNNIAVPGDNAVPYNLWGYETCLSRQEAKTAFNSIWDFVEGIEKILVDKTRKFRKVQSAPEPPTSRQRNKKRRIVKSESSDDEDKKAAAEENKLKKVNFGGLVAEFKRRQGIRVE